MGLAMAVGLGLAGVIIAGIMVGGAFSALFRAGRAVWRLLTRNETDELRLD